MRVWNVLINPTRRTCYIEAASEGLVDSLKGNLAEVENNNEDLMRQNALLHREVETLEGWALVFNCLYWTLPSAT